MCCFRVTSLPVTVLYINPASFCVHSYNADAANFLLYRSCQYIIIYLLSYLTYLNNLSSYFYTGLCMFTTHQQAELNIEEKN